VRVLVLGLLSLFNHSTVLYAQQSIPCLVWCAKCDAGSECITECLLQEQPPMRDVSCIPIPEPKPKPKAVGMPCYDWCHACKPDDTACPGRCDRQGKPLMTRACPPQ
jgi:hypothetical protein